MKEFTVTPNPTDPQLVNRVSGWDQNGATIETSVPVERPRTVFVNGPEIVTVMKIGHRRDVFR